LAARSGSALRQPRQLTGDDDTGRRGDANIGTAARSVSVRGRVRAVSRRR